MDRKKQFRELTKWLKQRVAFAERLIKEARSAKNYGKEIEYESKKNAFLECLNRLPDHGGMEQG